MRPSDLIGSGDAERELDGTGFAAEMACGEQIAIYGVGARDVDDFIVKESRAFARIRQTDAARRAVSQVITPLRRSP
jgi:hypothetical protein